MEFLCSFRPLAASPPGRAAARQFNLPPFIDASCRREPDLQSRYPSISALCRKQYFAPRLRPGDRIVYITVKRAYTGPHEPHRHLVAILEVKHSFNTHRDAAAWYRGQGAAPPSNCMVFGNPPQPLDHTDRFHPALRRWDAEYRLRARKWGIFHACASLFLDLHTPPTLTDADLKRIFGSVPATQTPPAITEEQLNRLKTLATSAAPESESRPADAH